MPNVGDGHMYILNSLERQFADEDNEQIDNDKLTARTQRQLRLLIVGLSAAILMGLAGTIYIYGVGVFSSMPLPQ
jgi:hypothetical protein